MARTIEFLRLGNPWLVGENVNRIVPLYALQNAIAPEFARDEHFGLAKDLAVNAAYAIENGLKAKVSVDAVDRLDLQETAFGLLSPEHRVFKNRKSGRADKNGAPFPLLAGFTTPTGSDDGLGKRVRELLERSDSDWRARLQKLFVPGSPPDPVSAFAWLLLKDPPGKVEILEPAAGKLTGFDKVCVDFVDALLDKDFGGNRISAIRALAYGIYFVAIIRMVAGPVVQSSRKGALPSVFAYAGLPPGRRDDPMVVAASASFQDWVSASWAATLELIGESLSKTAITTSGNRKDDLRARLQIALKKRLERSADLEGVLEDLEPLVKRHGSLKVGEWVTECIDDEPIKFSQHELGRRVRSLGANIGFAGPDRGRANARLLFDTPLLGVLVKGLLANTNSMPLEDFVSLVAEKFGVFLGPGSEDELVDRIDLKGTGGLDTFELLKNNQDLLRDRLLRAGLARAYSDSHTEVISHA